MRHGGDLAYGAGNWNGDWLGATAAPTETGRADDEGMEALWGEERVLYVLYADMTGTSWRMQCVPMSSGSFQWRKPLSKAWRGRQDAELYEWAVIDGCVFAHVSGFIRGNGTFEGAVEI